MQPPLAVLADTAVEHGAAPSVPDACPPLPVPARISGSWISGVGACLPQRRVVNGELPASLGTSDAWIRTRTGIRARYVAGEGESTASLAVLAARRALANAAAAGRTGAVDLIIVATSTPDLTMPNVATLVQRGLQESAGGAQAPQLAYAAQLPEIRGAACDVQAACAGFVYALAMADGLLRAGTATRALVIGAETMSRIVDWNDRSTCVLFGDGAGAVVLERSPACPATPNTAKPASGVLASTLHADGTSAPLLCTTGGVGTTGAAGVLTMAGREVFRHGVEKMAEAVQQCLAAQGLTVADLDWLIPHQANARMLDAVAERLGIDRAKVIMDVAEHANTSAASIPLALAGAAHGMQRGQLVALTALGAGLTWGACILRW